MSFYINIETSDTILQNPAPHHHSIALMEATVHKTAIQTGQYAVVDSDLEVLPVKVRKLLSA